MSTIPSLEQLLEAGVHFGHRPSRWHPKMAPFIFGKRSDIHIIDLQKTQEQLQKTGEFLKSLVARGGIVLFVGTKVQAKDAVKRAAQSCGMPYVTERWLGGTLTNFQEVKLIIKRFKMLRDQQEKGELRKYTKKEQIVLGREIKEMEVKIGGIQDLARPPDAMFVVDIKTEMTAVEEATKLGVKVVALCDTNVNPGNIDYVIPANDDATKGIDLLCQTVALMVNEGKASSLQLAAGSADVPMAVKTA
ncbi:30S ribosomal protein S2 [Candidatus Uhrbacteria bacterium]|nr:30S ribosomal protein S2 [Candidatus Uhrbacteria bacterium]